MSEEVVAVEPAPELETTAVTPEPVETPTPEVKTFTQEEVDAIVSKRLARDQRKWEREHSVPKVPDAQTVDAPKPEQFGSNEEYNDALVTHRAAKLLELREEQRMTSEILESYHEKEDKVREKYDDFETVAYNPKLKISTVMAQAIQSSDIGPEVAYYLGSNPKEADRIFKLPPVVQAREIGRLEAKVAADVSTGKKASNAPTPISPVTPRGSGSAAYDTTDPRSVKTMTTSQWIEAENARLYKKAEQAAKMFG